MALNATNVRVAGTGEVYVAAVGVTAISSVSTALPSATWTGLGYTSEDGVSVSRERDTEEINSWQSATPVRILTTGNSLSVSTTFIESKAKVLEMWWGAPFVTNTTEWKADISAIPSSLEYALCVEWVDGSKTSRLFVPRVSISETGDMTLNRTEATAFEVSFDALAPASGPLASWLSNDAALNPSA